MSDARRSLEVPPDAAGMRLDVWLAGALELPRARVKELLELGAVRIGGRPPRKGDRTVAGARVEVTLPTEDPRPVPQPELACGYSTSTLSWSPSTSRRGSPAIRWRPASAGRW